MKCKDCGKEITGDEYKKVADWLFCLECFEKLMDQSEKESEAEAAAPEESVDAAEKPSVSSKPVCQTCGKEIDSGQEKKLGIWTFCSQCHGDLIFRPPKPAPTEDLPEEDQDEAQKKDVGPDGIPLGRVRVETIKKVDCHGCGRPILEKAGREVDGNLFCPECFYAMPEQVVVDVKAELRHPDRAPEKVASEDVPATVARPTDQICESCQRVVIDGHYDTLEGFAICKACLATDSDMALKIAKARHQKYLQQLKGDYEP